MVSIYIHNLKFLTETNLLQGNEVNHKNKCSAPTSSLYFIKKKDFVTREKD